MVWLWVVLVAVLLVVLVPVFVVIVVPVFVVIVVPVFVVIVVPVFVVIVLPVFVVIVVDVHGVVPHSGGTIEDGATKLTALPLPVVKAPAGVQELISPSIRQISFRKLLLSYPPI